MHVALDPVDKSKQMTSSQLTKGFTTKIVDYLKKQQKMHCVFNISYRGHPLLGKNDVELELNDLTSTHIPWDSTTKPHNKTKH